MKDLAAIEQMMDGIQFELALNALYKEDRFYQANAKRLRKNSWLLIVQTNDSNYPYFVQFLNRFKQ